MAKLYIGSETVLETRRNNGSDLFYHHTEYGGARTSRTTGRPKILMVFV